MILLSSYGLRSPIVADNVREYINPENKKVLIIPFAGFNNASTAAKEINEGLIPYRFALENIYVVDAEEPELYKKDNFDIIYVPGGNPFKLLSQVQKCSIKQWIVDQVVNGAIYFGASSGADFVCGDLEYLKLVDDCNYEIRDFEGLGLIKEKCFVILIKEIRLRCNE